MTDPCRPCGRCCRYVIADKTCLCSCHRPPYLCPKNDPDCPESGDDFMCRSQDERDEESQRDRDDRPEYEDDDGY